MKRALETEDLVVEKKQRDTACIVCDASMETRGKFFCKNCPDAHLLCDSCGESTCRVKPQCPIKCGPLYKLDASGKEVQAPKLAPFVVKEMEDGLRVPNNTKYLMERWPKLQQYKQYYNDPPRYQEFVNNVLRCNNEEFLLNTLIFFRTAYPVIYVNAIRQGTFCFMALTNMTLTFVDTLVKHFKLDLITQVMDRPIPAIPDAVMRHKWLDVMRFWIPSSTTVLDRVLCFLLVSNSSRASLNEDLEFLDLTITDQWLLDHRAVVVQSPPSLVADVVPPHIKKMIGDWVIHNLFLFDTKIPASLSYFLTIYAPKSFIWPPIMKPMPSVSEPFMPHFTYFPEEGRHYYAPERCWRDNPRLYNSLSSNISRAMVTIAPIPESKAFADVNYMVAIFDPEHSVSTVYVYDDNPGELNEAELASTGKRVGSGTYFVKMRFLRKILGGFGFFEANLS